MNTTLEECVEIPVIEIDRSKSTVAKFIVSFTINSESIDIVHELNFQPFHKHSYDRCVCYTMAKHTLLSTRKMRTKIEH